MKKTYIATSVPISAVNINIGLNNQKNAAKSPDFSPKFIDTILKRKYAVAEKNIESITKERFMGNVLEFVSQNNGTWIIAKSGWKPFVTSPALKTGPSPLEILLETPK